MPTLSSLIESEFLMKDCPRITSNLKVQTRLTDTTSAVQNTDLSDIVVEKLSDKKFKDCLIKFDSAQSMNAFNNKKSKEKVNIIDKTCTTNENFVHTSISNPIDDILDNETSLDISLSDLPGNCSFEDISLSEIDVQRIDTNDSIIEQNSKEQNMTVSPSATDKTKNSNNIQSIDVINDFSSVRNDILQCRLGNNFQVDEFVNKNTADSILNVKHSMVNDTGNNKYVDINYMEQSPRESSGYNDYVLDGAHLASFPNQIYIINDEVYIGQLVTIQNIDDVKDDQSITPRNEELQEPVQENYNNYAKI
ncbi:hypothetical protein EVAR_90690_1 [Eumeta japonica]|uniref:Uncharacterized protein n=1 Tax=Eumeta variegata TaxID=151549 RepID=A0A4C1YUV9_EUMVA|nr:hypothetical protein EVAR_90690_1 [Eumeta japonica]